MPRPPRRDRPVPVQHEWSEVGDLQPAVLDLCKLMHLLAYHPYDSRRSRPGYPDLTIAGLGGVLWVELKSATGQLEPDQILWRDALLAAGEQWRLWRPADWFNGTIATELSMLRRSREVVPVSPSPWGEYLRIHGRAWSRDRSLYETRPGDPAALGLPDVQELEDFEPTTGHRHNCIPRDRDVCECAAQLYALAARGQEQAA